MEPHCISDFSYGDRVPGDTHSKGGRVYLGLPFKGEAHHGRVACVAGSLCPRSRKQSKEGVCSAPLLRGVPGNSTTNIRVSHPTSVNI